MHKSSMLQSLPVAVFSQPSEMRCRAPRSTTVSLQAGLVSICRSRGSRELYARARKEAGIVDNLRAFQNQHKMKKARARLWRRSGACRDVSLAVQAALQIIAGQLSEEKIKVALSLGLRRQLVEVVAARPCERFLWHWTPMATAASRQMNLGWRPESVNRTGTYPQRVHARASVGWQRRLPKPQALNAETKTSRHAISILA